MLRIHYLQHVPFEDLDNIVVWASRKGHSISGTRLFKKDRFPWLVSEKRFIEAAITSRKTVLGICPGAQLIAVVLRARV